MTLKRLYLLFYECKEQIVKLVIISGSTRNRSTSNKMAEKLAQYANTSHYFSEIAAIDFAKLELPIWDPSLKLEYDLWQHEWEHTADLIREADAIMIVSPEWEEASLSNFYAFSRLAQLPLIPCLIVRLSSECRGAYSAVDLTMNNFTDNSTFLAMDHIVMAAQGDTALDDISDRLLMTFKLMQLISNNAILNKQKMNHMM